MKKIFTIALMSLFVNSAFAEEVKEVPISKGINELLSYEQPTLNFFKPHEFKISDAQIIDISYDKYALLDLGVNEQQFLKHIDEFNKHALNYLEDKDVSGPMLISFSLKAVYPPKDKNIECSQTPKKCSLNSIENILDPQYKAINQNLAPYVIQQLDKESHGITDISKDYSEPIISNFQYIGAMRAFILINLTSTKKMTSRDEKLLKTIKKNIPDLLYPEGEASAKQFSELQQKYWAINQKNSNELNKNNENNENNEKEIVDEKEMLESETLTDEQKIIMEFNQQRQKLFPLPSQRFNSQNNNKT